MRPRGIIYTSLRSASFSHDIRGLNASRAQAGFLGGWIVLHLIARGEDPHRIRILDIRRPIRQDLLEGPAAQVDFCQVDISNAAAVEEAFRKPWPTLHDGPEPELT